MTEVARLSVSITADSRGLQTGLRDAEQQVQAANQRMERSALSLSNNTVTAMTAMGVTVGGAAVRAAMNWESAFAGVRKTVDGTDAELAVLEDTLLRMSRQGVTSGLDNAAVTLAGIAEIAGQLGVKRADIAEFTDVIAQLGMTTNISGEEAALMLAQFANITKMDMSDIDRLGSTVVALGNNMATTERDIVMMSQRLAGAGELAGLSEGEILGLAAALASVGINAEAGGTSMSRVMKDFTEAINDTSLEGQEKLDALARISGVTADEFVDAWRSEPADALASFVTGLGELDEGARLAYLSALGFDDIRISDSLLRLSNNSDLLTQALDIQGEAWQENSALQDEAAQRFATTEAQLNRFENNLNAVAIALGDVALPTLNQGLSAGGQLFDIGNLLFGGDLESMLAAVEPIEVDPMDFFTMESASATTTIDITVEPGDTIWALEQETGLARDVLMQAFGLEDPRELRAGASVSIDIETEGYVQNIANVEEAFRRMEHAISDTSVAAAAAEPLSGLDKAMIGLNVTVREFTGADLPFVAWARDIQSIVPSISIINDFTSSLISLDSGLKMAATGGIVNPVTESLFGGASDLAGDAFGWMFSGGGEDLTDNATAQGLTGGPQWDVSVSPESMEAVDSEISAAVERERELTIADTWRAKVEAFSSTVDATVKIPRVLPIALSVYLADGGAAAALSAGVGVASGLVGQFASGGLVPQTGLALVHEGERVLTPSETRSYDRGSGPIEITSTLVVDGRVMAEVVNQHNRDGRR